MKIKKILNPISASMLFGLFLLFFNTNISKGATVVCPSKYKIPDTTTQLVTVRYKGNSKGLLTYYEKKADGTWKKLLTTNAYLGRRGIGKKKEGDKKTPTGMYTLGQSFGILKNPGTRMPYVKVNKNHYWCGDSGSEYYNQLVNTKKIKHNCRGEHLINYKGYYDYGIFIGYNKKGKAGKGSAIFLHCSMGKSTAGCVAIPKSSLKKILRRLDPEKNPRIIIF